MIFLDEFEIRKNINILGIDYDNIGGNKLIHYLFSKFNLNKNSEILEIESKLGANLLYFKKLFGCNCTGVEKNMKILDVSKNLLKNTKIQINPHIKESKLNNYDLIFYNNILNKNTNIIEYFDIIYNLLKVNGYIFIGFPYCRTDKMLNETGELITNFYPYEIISILDKFNFKEIKFKDEQNYILYLLEEELCMLKLLKLKNKNFNSIDLLEKNKKTMQSKFNNTKWGYIIAKKL